MEKIVVGKIVNTFGLRGELKVLMNQNIKLDEFFIEGYENTFKCEKQVNKKGYVKIKIYAYDDINIVMPFVNHNILVDHIGSEKLEENEYLVSDLIGSKILNGETEIGIITNVENFGATDILVFEQDGKEHRVPFVLDFFEKIEPKQKILFITEKFFEGAV